MWSTELHLKSFIGEGYTQKEKFKSSDKGWNQWRIGPWRQLSSPIENYGDATETNGRVSVVSSGLQIDSTAISNGKNAYDAKGKMEGNSCGIMVSTIS